jgi:hypothetical protein
MLEILMSSPWIFILCGIAGAIGRCIISRRFIVVPCLDEWVENGKTRQTVDPGFIGDLATGIIVALFVDRTPEMAFLGALGAPYILERLIERTKKEGG